MAVTSLQQHNSFCANLFKNQVAIFDNVAEWDLKSVQEFDIFPMSICVDTILQYINTKQKATFQLLLNRLIAPLAKLVIDFNNFLQQ